MISIIISSAKKNMLTDVLENIKGTIGIPYEVLSVDNAKGSQGMCSIYNKGARDAKFDILCFMHEDVNIKTLNWGEIVLKCFKENHNLGVLGVVGSAYKSKGPTGWGALSSERKILYFNYIQGFGNRRPSQHYIENPLEAEISKVVSVDGMWFCTPKEICLAYPFDEEMLSGFHCYDLDYCFQVGQSHDVAVTFNILMEHFSEGAYTKQWWQDTLKLHHKWKVILPAAVEELSDDHKFLIEKRAYRWVIDKLVGMGYSWVYINRFLIGEISRGNIGLVLFLKGYLFSLRYLIRKTSDN
jgi:hypothetical protein